MSRELLLNPPEEPLAADLAAAPFLIGADGVMVPFRPAGGLPRGKTAWHEIKGGVLARLGRQTTRTGTVVARLPQRRLVAVFGEIAALQRRLWLEARRPGILRAPQMVWLRDGARGVWHLCEARCARHATEMLDFSHAAHHLWQGAAAWVDGRTT